MNGGVKTIQVRMPAELHEAIKELSYRERQSMNQFMVAIMKDRVEKAQGCELLRMT